MIEHNGKMYTTVTEALGFAAGYHKIPPEILNRAANRGTRCHSAISGHFRGLGTWDMDADIIGYYESARTQFHTITDIQALESRYYNDEMLLSGQVDMIARFGEHRCLIDWKTSAKPSKIWPLQAAAYTRLSGCPELPALFVQLQKDGTTPNFHFYTVEELEIAWQRFLLCFEVHKLFFANKEDYDLCQMI